MHSAGVPTQNESLLAHLLRRRLARMRTCGEALIARSSPDNRAAQWTDRNRATPPRARSRCCSIYQATSSARASATTRDPHDKSPPSSAARRVPALSVGASAAHRDRSP
jgi:hypothetical protein